MSARKCLALKATCSHLVATGGNARGGRQEEQARPGQPAPLGKALTEAGISGLSSPVEHSIPFQGYANLSCIFNNCRFKMNMDYITHTNVSLQSLFHGFPNSRRVFKEWGDHQKRKSDFPVSVG